MYLSGRYFSAAIDYKLKNRIRSYYDGEKWDTAKANLIHKPISLQAYKIAQRIKKDLGIELFPLIINLARKGFDISGGTYAFYMIDDNGKDRYFDCHAKEYVLKRNELSLYYDGHEELITCGIKPKNNK